MAYTKVVINDPLYLQPDTYSAQDDRRFLADLLSEGVVGTNDFLVTFSSGLTVSVDAGTAYIPGLMVADQGMYRLRESAAHTIAVGVGDGTNPRIDQIILRVLDAVHDTSGLYETRIEVVPGTPTTGATLANRNGVADLAALTENSKNVLLLADVLVPAAAGSIDSTKIGDQRDFAQVGGGNIGGGGSVGTFYDNLLTVDTANFDIPSIPAGALLEFSLYARTTEAVITSSATIRYNNDSSAIYDRYRARASGNTPAWAGSAEALGATLAMISEVPGANATANKFASVQGKIPHYAGIINHKVATIQASHVENVTAGGFYVSLYNIVWRSIAAINRLTIMPQAGNFKAGSRCTVYVR